MSRLKQLDWLTRNGFATDRALVNNLNVLIVCLVAPLLHMAAHGETVKVERIGDGPIIHAELHPSIGVNIQGPSLIRVPEWVASPLGRYYLYFADHKGAYIRLAYADALEGPWQIHVPGSLQLQNTPFLQAPPELTEDERQQIIEAFAKRGAVVSHDPITEVTSPHIASPDVIIDEENQRFVMFYHGLEGVGHQVTRVSTSKDGVRFESGEEVLGRTYWRSFQWRDHFYALAMPGQLYRSSSLLTGYEKGPLLFNPDMRHNAVLVRDDTLHIFWTQVGDVPEHVKHSTIRLSDDWQDWRVSGGSEVLRPKHDWEGGEAPLEPSVRSTAYGLVNQLRDPAIFVEDDSVYLLYAYGGESGIAIARVEF